MNMLQSDRLLGYKNWKCSRVCDKFEYIIVTTLIQYLGGTNQGTGSGDCICLRELQ